MYAAYGDLSTLCSRRMTTLPGAKFGGLEIASSHLRSLTGGRCQLSVEAARGSDDYSGAVLRLGPTSFQYFQFNWESECQTWTKRATAENIVVYTPLSGSFVAYQSSRSVEVNPGQSLIVSSSGEIRRRWTGPSELINLVIPREALNRILAIDYGVDTRQQLSFDSLMLVSSDRVLSLLNFIEMIIGDAGSENPIFADPVVARQAHSTMAHLILKSFPHNHSESVNGERSNIAPFYVRRAEDYITQNLSKDITIEDLAAASGVSVRTIYYGFKRYRQLSPMKYLKRLRLTQARKELVMGRAAPCKVADVADGHGYANASQFSRDYKDFFGESPQATLRSFAAPPDTP